MLRGRARRSMAAGISSRKLAKELLHKLAVLTSSIGARVPVAPTLLPQPSAWGFCHSIQRVRNLCAQSAWQLQRRGWDDVRRAFDDLRDGSSGQQRLSVRSTSEKAKPDADSIAIKMIKYASSCPNRGKLTQVVADYNILCNTIAKENIWEYSQGLILTLLGAFGEVSAVWNYARFSVTTAVRVLFFSVFSLFL